MLRKFWELSKSEKLRYVKRNIEDIEDIVIEEFYQNYYNN